MILFLTIYFNLLTIVHKTAYFFSNSLNALNVWLTCNMCFVDMQRSHTEKGLPQIKNTNPKISDPFSCLSVN